MQIISEMLTGLSTTYHPLLVETPVSQENIATPPETTDHWVALDCGGFDQCSESVAWDRWKQSRKPDRAITKKQSTKMRRKKDTSAGGDVYFDVDMRCSNTWCTLPPRHGGLCSHLQVAGRRNRAKVVDPFKF